MRAEHPLVLQSLERGVDRPDGILPAGTLPDLTTDGETVRVVSEARDSEEN